MSVLKSSSVLLVFVVLSSQLCVLLAFAQVGESEAASALTRAEGAVSSGYRAVLKTESVGANVSGLLVRLNDAGRLLAAARMSFRNGDFDTVGMLADLSENIGVEVEDEAVKLNASALDEGSRRSLFTVVASAMGVAAVGLGMMWVWHVFKKRYGQYRSWFIVACLALMLVAVAPASALYVHLPSGSEKFSELWLLGPGHKAEDYPYNIRINETYSVYVGVGNHLGHSAYYRVYVKFRNETQPLPVASNSTPSSMQELYEYGFFVRDGGVWETLQSFRILDAERLNDSVILKSLSINDFAFEVGSISLWNGTRKGFYHQLFFELWLFNMTSQNFEYHNRFVNLWLNVTT